jgi:hypothetical protein
VVTFTTLLNSTWVTALAALSAAAAATRLPSLVWNARFKTRASEHRRMTRLVNDGYVMGRKEWVPTGSERPGASIYDFVDVLNLGHSAPRRSASRLVSRVLRIDQMAHEQRSSGCSLAMAWAQGVSEFARKMTLEERLSLRPFLATFHLTVIREGALSEPFLVWALVRGELPLDMEDVRMALALRDLARAYNSVAAQQREEVTFLGTSAVIQYAPPWWMRPLRSVQDHSPSTFRRLKLRSRFVGWRLGRAMASARRKLPQPEVPEVPVVEPTTRLP